MAAEEALPLPAGLTLKRSGEASAAAKLVSVAAKSPPLPLKASSCSFRCLTASTRAAVEMNARSMCSGSCAMAIGTARERGREGERQSGV